MANENNGTIKTAKDIMTKEVYLIRLDTSVTEAAKIMDENGLDGLPIVDKDKVLLGIVTQYDLIKNAAHVHLPTLQIIFKNLYIKDSKEVEEEKKKITSLAVKDVMNPDPLILKPDVDIAEVISLFKDHHLVNPIPVIDESRRVIGIISRYDIIKLLHFNI